MFKEDLKTLWLSKKKRTLKGDPSNVVNTKANILQRIIIVDT